MQEEKYEKMIDKLLRSPFGTIQIPIPEKPSLQFLDLISKITEDLEYSDKNNFYIRPIKLSKYREDLEKFNSGSSIIWIRFAISNFKIGNDIWWDRCFEYNLGNKEDKIILKQGNSFIVSTNDKIILTPLTINYLANLSELDLRCLVLYGFLDDILNDPIKKKNVYYYLF